jgi:hypothetical protein
MPSILITNLKGQNYTDYLDSLIHTAVLCDRCMTHVQGEWFWCAYCAKDLCDTCEAVDTHDSTHVFLVFKSTVDMQLFRCVSALATFRSWL